MPFPLPLLFFILFFFLDHVDKSAHICCFLPTVQFSISVKVKSVSKKSFVKYNPISFCYTLVLLKKHQYKAAQRKYTEQLQ